jgi:hypothetical protein
MMVVVVQVLSDAMLGGPGGEGLLRGWGEGERGIVLGTLGVVVLAPMVSFKWVHGSSHMRTPCNAWV